MSAPVTFSVVVPCHNAARYLRDTLASALGQNHAPLEVLVVVTARLMTVERSLKN